MDAENEMTMFRRRLAETIAWCAGRASVADPRNSLRTPALLPATLDDTRGWRRHRWGSVPEKQAMVSALADERATLLRAENRYPERPAENLAGGCLLLYDPDDTLSDGCAEEESRGFFAADNTPAWDTWITYTRERARGTERWTPFEAFLVSWVPPQLLDLAQDGIWINPEECIVWATDHDAAFTHHLREAGLLG